MAAGTSEFYANNLIRFINQSPTPFHVVQQTISALTANGFTQLRENQRWDIKPLGKYYVTKNQSAIIAFMVGGKYAPGNGFSIVGAHTDSPCLKLKPVSRKEQNGFIELAVAPYGGACWYTWFDRELKLAGRVVVKNDDHLESRLLDIHRPLARIPTLAIHLDRTMSSEWKYNTQDHLLPVLATKLTAQLNQPATDDDKDTKARHSPLLLRLLCDELKVNPDQIIDHDLSLSDFTPAIIGGVLNEFVFAPRLDNQFSCYTALQGLIESADGDSLKADTNVRMVCMFDNEEIGSNSAQGAASLFMQSVLRQIAGDSFEIAIAQSFLVSADNGHALHPNYKSSHESEHEPMLHEGMILKYNIQQRYATTAVTASVLKAVAERVKVPLQDFVVRNDKPCGSTIGPITSTGLGIATVDVGAAQLSMHSIREMCSTTSVQHAVQLFKGFFILYPDIWRNFKLD